MKKVIAALLICACLALGSETTSSAAMLPDFGIAHPMAQECGNCGKMTLLNQYSYTDWELAAVKICSKNSTKVDEVYSRLVKRYFRCSNCGYTFLVNKYYEEKIVCNH